MIDQDEWAKKKNSGKNKKYKHFILPYRYRIITATNIPFRVNLENGNTDADFTNFNIAPFWVFGRSKIFKNDFIQPRNVHFGIGPFVGLTSLTTDKANDKKGFGISYGANAVFSIFNFNLIVGYGRDTGFNGEAKKTDSWLGIGIGLNLVTLFDPTAGSKN